MAWIRDRALTLVLMAMFLLFLVGQGLTGFAEYNDEQHSMDRPPSRWPTISPPVTPGKPFSRTGKAVPADGRVRLVDDVLDSEGVTGVETTGCQGTGRYRSTGFR